MLLRDNTRPYPVTTTMEEEEILNLGADVFYFIQHIHQTLHQVIPNFFRSVQNVLNSKKFSEEDWLGTTAFFTTKPSEFYPRGTNMLFARWQER